MCFRYDGRLIFKDLNSNSLLNGVQTSALNHLWTPQLAFVNALGPYQTVVDDISVCTIVLEENPTFNDLTNSLECKYKDCKRTIWIKRVSDYGFDANTNAINLEREYYQVFSCEFNLYYYNRTRVVVFRKYYPTYTTQYLLPRTSAQSAYLTHEEFTLSSFVIFVFHS